MSENDAVVLDMLQPHISELIQEFLEKVKGKGMKEMLPVLAEFKGRLPKDQAFSDAEKNAILEAALNGIPDEEQNRYKSFMKMIGVLN